MRLPLPAAALLAILLGAATVAARAADFPVPKVFSDAPKDKGSWRMEILEAPGRDPNAMRAMGGAMTFCSSAAEAMARDRAHPGASEDTPQCNRKLLEDSPERAVMETTCTGSAPRTMKSTIVRTAPRSYEISNETTSETTNARRPEPVKMRVKMSYAGPCSAQDAALKLDSNSPACARVQSQMAQMDPAKCPAGAGNAPCVERMTAARAQMQAMCK